MNTTITNLLRLPTELIDRYDALARAAGRSRNGLMAEALRDYIDRAEDTRRLAGGLAALDRGAWTGAEQVYEEHVSLAARAGLSRQAYEAGVRADMREQLAALGLPVPAALCV